MLLATRAAGSGMTGARGPTGRPAPHAAATVVTSSVRACRTLDIDGSLSHASPLQGPKGRRTLLDMAAQECWVPAADPAASPAFEYRSRLKIGRLPLVHVVSGIDPSTGRRPPAVGVVAVGQVAIGVVAIGQVAIGAISIGQAAIALGWGVGQLAWGMLAAGQVAAGLLGSVGQVAFGPGAIGMVHAS